MAMRFLVIPGTVRDGRASIHAARYVTQLFQEAGHDAELFDLAERDVPFLQERRYKTENPHPDVEAFGQLVEESDGLIIVTPEYNHTLPGALKNLLDHLYPEYEDKPFSYVTVSNGPWGGVRMQEDLNRLTVVFKAYPGPNLPVRHVGEVFDAEGNIVDADYQERFEDFVEEAVAHTERFSS